MVLLPYCLSENIDAYTTAPLTQAMVRTVHHGFYDGSYARFGEPQYIATIHDRPEYHGLSHYDLRNLLDAEGKTDQFIIIDNNTPENNAVWYVETTTICKFYSNETRIETVTYSKKNFTLWQAYLRVSNVLSSAASWSVGCSDIVETVTGYYYPYDPHDPQNEIISLRINWTDSLWQ